MERAGPRGKEVSNCCVLDILAAGCQLKAVKNQPQPSCDRNPHRLAAKSGRSFVDCQRQEKVMKGSIKVACETN